MSASAATRPRKCDGACLEQSFRDPFRSYVRIHECKDSCQLVPCPNYTVCQTKLPQILLDCHWGRCLQCNILLGKDLSVRNDEKGVECDICYETKTVHIKGPWCSHWQCLECFRRVYRIQPENTNSDIANQFNNKELLQSRRANTSNNDDDEGDEPTEEDDEQDEEKFIGKCPFCRAAEGQEWRGPRV